MDSAVSFPGTAVIVGTGGFAVELAGLLRDAQWDVRGFVGPQPDRDLPGDRLGDDDALAEAHAGSEVFVAVGDPTTRRRLCEAVVGLGRNVAGFRHPAAHIDPTANLGEGSVVYPNATIHADVVLGRSVLVNSNATIGHETAVGDYVNIGPGAALGGCVTLGEGAYVGIGACLIERLNVAPGATIGAGATLVNNAEKVGVYVGTPAALLGN